MPPDTTKEQFNRMLQNLLIERFHLVYHRETRSFPGYALVIDKDGPKIREVKPGTEGDPGQPADVRATFSAPRGSDGFPEVPGPRTISIGGTGGQTRTKYQERTMAEFISNLGFLIGSSQGRGVLDGFLQPRVIDKTGLAGKYTFILEYHSAGMANLQGSMPFRTDADPGGASQPGASDPDGSPNIFTAIQKQLGLRLDKTADVPTEVIVVESVDKTPTAN
jgi:uncharacterized protein (TIGR03435 family)